MRAIETITGPRQVLNRDDVDTDQIIPKQFLKRIERTGFGRVPLLRLGQGARLGPAEQPDPRRGAQLRLRLEPRACSMGARGLRLSGDHRAELRRHLPLQLHEDRAAAGRAPGEACEAIAQAGEAQVDLRAQEVRWPGGCARFEIDPEIKHRLLNGLDDIGLTLDQAAAIDAYEHDRERPGPLTTALDRG